MRTLRSPDVVERALKHPAMAERAAVEVALSRLFFAPFEHQEVAEGEAFVARARWSRAALARIPMARVEQAAKEAFDHWHNNHSKRPSDSLLDQVRRVCVRATVDLTLGSQEPQLNAIALAAVGDFDRHIKHIDRPHRARRAALKAALRQRLGAFDNDAGDPAMETPPCYLSVASDEARALSVRQRIDHVASVFLGTGSIQICDTVCHALIALAQHPAAAECGDAAVIAETIRLFPVNASLTRRASAQLDLDPPRLHRGDVVSVVPAKLNSIGWRNGAAFDPTRWEGDEGYSFAFGHGPRACPARQLALHLCATLLNMFRTRVSYRIEAEYPHRRSLARPISVTFATPGAPPSTPPAAAHRLAHALRYARACASTYPRALLRAWPQL